MGRHPPHVAAIFLAAILVTAGPTVPVANAFQVPGVPYAATQAEMDKIQAPRPLRQALKNALLAKQDEDVPKLTRLLGVLMEGVARTDYLVEDPRAEVAEGQASAPLVSMRGQLDRLLNELSESQRDAFEALYGSRANTALDDAVSAGDMNAIEQVAYRWRYTRSGAEAVMLVARWRMDQARFGDAARLLTPLRTNRVVRERFEPELSQLLVSALWMRGERAAAVEQVRRIADEQAWVVQRTEPPWRAVFEAARRQTPAASEEAAASKAAIAVLHTATDRALAQTLGPPTRTPRTGPVWPMFLGGPQRGATVNLNSQPNQIAWRTGITQSDALAEHIERFASEQIRTQAAMLPAASPLLVNDQVIVRTADRLVALSLEDGRQSWAHPFEFEPPESTRPPAAAQIQIFGQINGAQMMVPQHNANYQRVWGNLTYGRLAADDQFVFAIEGGFDLPTARQQQMILMAARGIRMPTRGAVSIPDVHNRLTAIDVRRQGAVAWVVGGASGEMNADFKRVFFLGPPLPHHGRLYVLYEQEEMVRLGVLDAETGATEWTLPLAPIIQGVKHNIPRRMLGAAPSLDGGVLICPTTVGGLVAVDVVRRQFLWGWAPSLPIPASNTRQMNIQRQAIAQMIERGGWRDRPVFIQGDRIVHATSGDELFCLDRDTGKLLWKRPRQDAWFVGCVSPDAVLLVGRFRYTALSLETGKPLWRDSPFRAIPAGGAPTGRGLLDGDAYLLPTSEATADEPPELLRIQLQDGRAERIPLTHRLGNLASNGSHLVAAGPDGVQLLGPDATASTPAGESTPQELTDAPIAELLLALRSDDFQVRQEATNQLKDRPLDEVLPALSELATGDNPELARRATSILLHFHEQGDSEGKLIDVLQQAAAATNGVRGLLPTPERQRKRAIATLISLGAAVHRDGETVILQRWRGKPDDAKLLRDIDNMRHLWVVSNADVNDVTKYLDKLPSLERLTLQHSPLNDEGLAKLGELPKLKFLDVQGTQVTDKSVEKFGQYQSLNSLTIRETKVTAEGAKRLKKLLPNVRLLGP